MYHILVVDDESRIRANLRDTPSAKRPTVWMRCISAEKRPLI